LSRGDRTDAIWRYTQPPATGSGQTPLHLSRTSGDRSMIFSGLCGHQSVSARRARARYGNWNSTLGYGIRNVSWSWAADTPPRLWIETVNTNSRLTKTYAYDH
jgi:hypothetical protein